MEDVTHLLDHYRECVRHLWNSGFRWLDTQDVQDFQDQYDDIASELFRIFVLQPIGRPEAKAPKEYEALADSLPFLHVVPISSEITIYINRSIPPSGYWDDPVDRIMTGETDLTLIHYFDFDVQGDRDLEYYLVRITRFDKHPHLVGRNALVRVNRTKVLHSKETL